MSRADNSLSALCLCGRRRGQHRYGDEACPNKAWRVGNGHSPWLTSRFTHVAVESRPWPVQAQAAGRALA